MEKRLERWVIRWQGQSGRWYESAASSEESAKQYAAESTIPTVAVRYVELREGEYIASSECACRICDECDEPLCACKCGAF